MLFQIVLFSFSLSLSFGSQEYEKLKADARAQGSGQREHAASLERQLASARSQLGQLGSDKVIGVGHSERCPAPAKASAL